MLPIICRDRQIANINVYIHENGKTKDQEPRQRRDRAK